MKRWGENEQGKDKCSASLLGPLQEGMAPIYSTLTFERISDYTGEKGRRRWEKTVLHRGLSQNSDDTLSLQQNNIVLAMWHSKASLFKCAVLTAHTQLQGWRKHRSPSSQSLKLWLSILNLALGICNIF